HRRLDRRGDWQGWLQRHAELQDHADPGLPVPDHYPGRPDQDAHSAGRVRRPEAAGRDARPSRQPGRLQGRIDRPRLQRERHQVKRRTLIRSGVALVALLMAAAAVAYWSTTGSGNASATAGTLSAPTNVVASASASTVSVSWTGSTITGGTPA